MSRVLTFIICEFGVQLQKPPRCTFTFLKFYKFSLKKKKSNYLSRFMTTAKARGKDAELNEKRRIPRRGSGKEENTRTHGWVTTMCAAAPDPAVILLGFMERRVWQVERGSGRERMEATGSVQVIRMRARSQECLRFDPSSAAGKVRSPLSISASPPDTVGMMEAVVRIKGC